jgi:hypothetical protein
MTPENRERTPLDIQELYRPPAVDEPAPGAPIATGAFYVVSPSKFLLLFMLTLGVYSYYWFYENWRRYRAHSGEYVSPFWRTVLNLFFTHRLFRSIDAQPAKAKSEVRWNAESMATLYVVLSIVGYMLGRLSSALQAEWLDMLAMACGLGTAYPLYVAQRVAHVAVGDAEGSTNGTFTAVNYVFMLLGGSFWLLIFLGMTIEDS